MASGWWDNDGAISGCVAAYAPVGAVDLAASYVNLQNPGTNNAAPGVAPSFATLTGWTFNGTTQYLTTGYTLPIAGAYLIRYANATGTDGRHGGSQVRVIPRFFGGRFWQNGGGSLSAGSATASGVIGAASKAAYHNGASAGTISAGATAETLPFFIGAINSAGSPANFAATDILAVALYSTAPSGAEIATLTTLMNALPVPTGHPAAARGVLVPGMNRDGRRVGASRIGWG